MFDQTMGGLIVSFDDPNVIDKDELFTTESNVSQYILGNMLPAGLPWKSVDEVLMPANTGDHWIMVRFDIKNRQLIVYDSVRNQGHDEHVVKTLRRYSVILPFFMTLLGIWGGSKLRRTKSKKSVKNPIEVVWQYGLPQQQGDDCGAFTLAFAEYYAADKMGEMKPDFDVESYRQWTACRLFHYGRMKMENGCISEDEI